MANFLFLKLIISLLCIYCESVSSDTGELPSDEESPLLTGGGQMSDDELWNLLKEISRNGSDKDPLDGFTDYEDYTLVDELYTTDVTEPSPIDNREIENSAGTETFNTESLDFESTTETTNSAATNNDITTENEPLEETVTFENVTPLDETEYSTSSNEAITSDSSVVTDVNETGIVTADYTAHETNYPSSTAIPRVNVSPNSSSGSTIIPSTSVSISLPDDLSSTEASLKPEVPIEITTTTVSNDTDSGKSTVWTTVTSPKTESTIVTTLKESMLGTSDAVVSAATTKQNGSFAYTTSTSVYPDKLSTKYGSTFTTPLTTTVDNVDTLSKVEESVNSQDSKLRGSSTTDANTLPSVSFETTTMSSINVTDLLITVPEVTDESKETYEFKTTPSTLIETSPSRTTPLVTSSVTPTNEVTTPFNKETDGFSTVSSTVNSTNLSEMVITTSTVSPTVMTDTIVISKSTISPISITTDINPASSTISNTMKSINESTVTEPPIKVIDELSVTPPIVNLNNVSQTLSSELTTPPVDTVTTTEVGKINGSTVTLPSTVTGTSLPSVTPSAKPMNMSDGQSNITKPSYIESTASITIPTTVNKLSSTASSIAPLSTEQDVTFVDVITSTVTDKIKTTVSETSATGNNRHMTTIPVITAQNTERTSLASTTPFMTNTLADIKSSKADDSSVTESTTTSSATEVVVLEKPTSPSVKADDDLTITFTTERNKEKTSSTTIKIIDEYNTQTKSSKASTSNPHQESVSTTQSSINYKVTMETVSTAAVFSTSAKVTPTKTKPTVSIPSSKKKILLDPSKKVFISIEDPIIPQLNLRENSPTTHTPQMKATTELLINKTKFYPQLKTTARPYHKATFEPGRKINLIPENKVESLVPPLDPEHMLKKNKVIYPNENIGSTTVKPCTNKHSSSRSNLDRSRIFMIDEATLTPMKLDLPPIPCCDKHLNPDTKSKNEPKGHTSPPIQNPYYKHDKITTNHEMKKDGGDPQPPKNAPSKKKLSFDPSRMHTLDSDSAKTPMPPFITAPTTMKKSTFDKKRKFMIDSDDTIKNTKPYGQESVMIPKEFSYNRKIMTRPVIQITPGINTSHRDKGYLGQTEFSFSKVDNEEIKYKNNPVRPIIHQSLPELLCFEVKNKDRKPILSCISLNSTMRDNFMHFLNNLDSYNRQQKSPILRKVVLKNQTPVATSVIIKTSPPLNKMKYSFSGHVLNTGNNNPRGSPSMNAFIKTPDRQVLFSNNQMQDIVRHSIIPIQHIASKQNILFLEQPPNPQSYQQIFPARIKKDNISNRSKRYITNKCNYDGVYEDEGSSLAFVFDNTGSMTHELEDMRETAKTITKELTEKKRNLIRDYILVTFNDPGNDNNINNKIMGSRLIVLNVLTS